MKRLTQLKLFQYVLPLIVFVSTIGCNVSPFSLPWAVASQFDVKLADIGFSRSNALFNSDLLSIRGTYLLFTVNVTPKESFSGEPFKTTKLGNEKIGITTIVQSTPAVFLVILSRDGYFFNGQQVVLTWTPEELRLPDPAERDYYKIQSIKEGRIKQVQIGVPTSDKATIGLLQDSNKLAAELQQDQWKWLIGGDWLLGEDLPKEADQEYIRSQFEKVFYNYFRLAIVDLDGLHKLQNPDATTKAIATWKGKGKFTSPNFTATYTWVNTSWTGNPTGSFQYNLYSADGKLIGGTRLNAEPNKKHSSGQPVKPGQRYYVQIDAPESMQWTFFLEETNVPP